MVSEFRFALDLKNVWVRIKTILQTSEQYSTHKPIFCLKNQRPKIAKNCSHNYDSLSFNGLDQPKKYDCSRGEYVHFFQEKNM